MSDSTKIKSVMSKTKKKSTKGKATVASQPADPHPTMLFTLSSLATVEFESDGFI
jgi:hypothetical protein